MNMVNLASETVQLRAVNGQNALRCFTNIFISATNLMMDPRGDGRLGDNARGEIFPTGSTLISAEITRIVGLFRLANCFASFPEGYQTWLLEP